jgi:hypothetical protein
VRVWFAFALAPATFIVADAIASLFFPEPMHAQFLVGRALWVASFAYPTALVLGIPLYKILRQYNLTQWHHFAVAGLVLSVPAAVLFVLGFGLFESGLFRTLPALGAFALVGCVSALVFWLIVFANRREAGA